MSLTEKIDRKDKILGNLSNNLATQVKSKGSNGYTLENLSASLVLSLERSKLIYELYEKNNSLKDKSDRLIRALNEEKHINNLQSEFVSLVSHEFKTPLAIIKMSADILKRVKFEGEQEKMVQKQLDKILKAILRMNNLIETTLNLSKLETGKLQFSPSVFCLRELITEIVDRFHDLNDKAKFIIQLGDEPLMFNGDKSLIDQVFTNLISNSLKYSKENPIIKISFIKKKNLYLLSFRDNGIGMSEKDQEKLFSKFFRAKNSVGIAGTGIGLYLVKQFLDLHNGDIKVKTKLGEGSDFILSLPTEY